MKKIVFYFFLIWISLPLCAARQPEFSTAGFFQLPGSGRDVYSMNPAWRFYKGSLPDASANGFDDSAWPVVSLPHGIEYLPAEASGCVNYQGEVWYRKHFTPDNALQGKKLFLHFEAIMGKCKVRVNGQLVTEHFGGYLPVIADITDAVRWDTDNVIAVWADNSDDPSYPPGKAQNVLDFTYFGGLYRDCWLIAHNPVFITDPNYENETAGGGLFVAYDNVSEEQADVLLKIQVRNAGRLPFTGVVEYELQRPDGQQVAFLNDKIRIKPGKTVTSTDKLLVKEPLLWSPESPDLYNLIVRIRDAQGNVIDGYRRRIGIRSLEFKGEEGFWLNGKPYPNPLIGANRHQDFAILGNAVPNSLHWRDAKKLRDAGMKVIRNAHCPQDPAFMDACDELGLFVIVNTPGWQFWNDAPEFAERVYSDIRNLVRRDRNHPCVWMWEPILNETWYPADFALNTRKIVDSEYPYPSCYSGCDSEARGNEYFPILFTHPLNGEGGGYSTKHLRKGVTYFTREWGDNVDDWNSHNSPSRAARNWGEYPMLIQAQHYAHPAYVYTSYDALYRTTRQHIGGCLWHSFDHQRGYHPDPFYGGVMDAFRQPKYAYYMFKAQRSPEKQERLFETGPVVYIAHAMTPFSPKDVTVYSNCDEVRLTFMKDGETHTYRHKPETQGMPYPVITFEGVYDFMADKAKSRARKQDEVYLLAEGLIDGKVVATHRVAPARHPEQIVLRIDNEGTELKADGSDVVTVVASIADKNGNIKRLNNDYIRFTVEGEGRIAGDAGVMANPRPVLWGDAPVLIQSTTRPGKIKITASVLLEGSQKPLSGEIELTSVPATFPLVYANSELTAIGKNAEATPAANAGKSDAEKEVERLQKELNTYKLKEVERQQTDFGEKR
ncbi:MAG: glycoside hydrolase family 2 protein [Parabacteroides sp.]|nr:glycoside hydrolase family 2 protein [Parabacteroides sp.]